MKKIDIDLCDVELTPAKLKKLFYRCLLDYVRHAMKYEITNPRLIDLRYFCDSWVDAEVRFTDEENETIKDVVT